MRLCPTQNEFSIFFLCTHNECFIFLFDSLCHVIKSQSAVGCTPCRITPQISFAGAPTICFSISHRAPKRGETPLHCGYKTNRTRRQSRLNRSPSPKYPPPPPPVFIAVAFTPPFYERGRSLRSSRRRGAIARTARQRRLR